MDHNYCKQNSTFEEWWDLFKQQCEEQNVVINTDDKASYQESYYDQYYTTEEAINEEVEAMEE